MSDNKGEWIIGYLDRIEGIKEIKFELFKRVHEDSELGIPFHRIRYFKMNENILWDRKSKIDLISNATDLF